MDKASDKANDKANDKAKDKASNKAVDNKEEKDYLDSNEGALKSVTSILNIPTEQKTEDQNSESVEDVLESSSEPSESSSYSSNDSSEEDVFDSSEDLGIDSEMFEDYELMSEIGIELIDMGFTYGAMAIAKDFENESKYSVKESRKKRLKKPLGLLLKNREQKVSPEVMFFVMLAATYSPVMIAAVKSRKEKTEAEKKKERAKKKGVLTQEYVDVMQSNLDSSFRDFSEKDSTIEEAKEVKKGRPKGATDIKGRSSTSPEERSEQMKKAKRMKDSGKSYSSIAKELKVSQATAIRWVKNAK